jgi:hypothetical protein
MKALICYWGLIRGFKYPDTLESHRKCIWNVLKDQGYETDIVMHTYNKEFDFQAFNIDNLKYFVIEDDPVITNRIIPKIKDINMPVYFSEEHRTGLFKCWHSQQHLHDYVKPIKEQYDIMITLDIAQYFVSPIPNNIKDMDMNTLFLSKFESFEGYNPRFCMSNLENGLFFLNKFNYVLNNSNGIPDNMVNPEYRLKYINAFMDVFNCPLEAVQGAPNLHPEWQLQTYLDKVGGKCVEELPIKFYRIRSNAHLEGLTQEDMLLYKVSAIPE